MSRRTEIARAYFDGFERNDHDAILGLLSDGVTWDIHGLRSVSGRGEFADAIEEPGFEAGPSLSIDRMIEASDEVIVPHTGETTASDGTPFRFAAVDILSFDENDLIVRVESWPVQVGG